MLVVPEFEFSKNQPDPPHVARVIARNEVPNEHGTLVVFTVKTSRKEDCWWIYASYAGGHRASNTLRTKVEAKGREWISAVESGQVRVDGEAETEKAKRR